MADSFVHLHVASGYSLRHGASHPHVLVERAAAHRMDVLALTDRDGVYGAVKFVTAAQARDIRPVLGVDLAVAPDTSDAPPAPRTRRAPVRGGATVDPRHPRATFLAVGRTGWASLCRLVSDTHLAGARGTPVTSLDLVAERASNLVVLLGPDSVVGRALARRRPDVARHELARWRTVTDPGCLVVEIVYHLGPGDVTLARRMVEFADQQRLPAVLSNAVRYADKADAPVADVLDAARQLVVLDPRHVGRVTAEGYLKSSAEMAAVAAEICGADVDAAQQLLARTRSIAERCVLDPKSDLGMGVPHLPDLAVDGSPDHVLRQRCDAGFGRRGLPVTLTARDRLDAELTVIAGKGYAAYFLTIADVVAMVKEMGVRCAARGSGAGSLVNYLLGISDVDPLEYGLLMERFLSSRRNQLPDVDLDVESARRTEVYERILKKYGGERCTCVSMMDTYRARHAIRDVGAALGMPPSEIDTIAKAFPHIRANQVRAALRDLPELRASGLGAQSAGFLFAIAERLDGLPRHIALHPCGVLLSDTTLLDRTPVEASWLGFPMSQFDKDDVEELGLLKLDVLGVRMQSAIAHALEEIERVDGKRVDIDAIPRDDPATYELIQSTRTLGMFQIESPGQRELVGKFAPGSFGDIIIDISLFRPGPVKSDMVTPFLQARQGWRAPNYLHDDLQPCLEETGGVVVFHEQVLQIFAVTTGCSLADADEARRALGDPVGQAEVQKWYVPTALSRGYDLATVERMWQVLKSFGSFGFCKAHAAAFAVPTYQSAWLKAHHPAAFLAGVLTHDPGMYPKRLILDDARQFGIAVLPLDINVSDATYRVERIDAGSCSLTTLPFDDGPYDDDSASGYGIRLSLADVKGITDAEVARIVAGRPYGELADFWQRARVSRPVTERLVLTGAFDAVYGIGGFGIGGARPIRRRGRITRRDLLLHVADLSERRVLGRGPLSLTTERVVGDGSIRARAAAQSQAAKPVHASDVQLTLDLGDASETPPSGLPELTGTELVRAELDVLGLDASRHVLTFYEPVLHALGVTRARDLLSRRSRAQVLIAGVKVATQTPPIRSGRRVVFVTVDDATGPADATFFEDAQVGYASTVFHSWLLVIRGTIRRTGPRGISLNATGAWDLTELSDAWRDGGRAAVVAVMARRPTDINGSTAGGPASDEAVHGAAESRALRPAIAKPPSPRKLWHSSPGSSGG